jgi:hypothetical protein
MGKLRSILSGAVGALLLLPALGLGEVQAQQPTPAQISAIRGSCRSDFMANCGGVTPGGRDALECLKRNLATLSPACKAAVSAVIPAPAPQQPAAAAPPAPPPPAPAAPPAANAAPSEPAAPPPAAPPAPKPQARPAAAAAGSAYKPSAAQIAAVRQSCRSDFMANCAGVTPGGKDALLCLERNAPRLSPGCKAAVAAAGAKRPPAPVGEAAPVAPPPTPAVTPLKLRPFILPQRRLVIVAICGPEVQRLCADVPPGGERILVCLALNAANLSPACYNAVARVSRP